MAAQTVKFAFLMFRRAVLCCAVLCCAVPCRATLCCAAWRALSCSECLLVSVELTADQPASTSGVKRKRNDGKGRGCWKQPWQISSLYLDTEARNCAHSCKNQPWFDSSCREALAVKEAVYKNSHSTAAEKNVAEKKFRSVTDRVKETWTQKRNVELCKLSARDPCQFWKAFKAPQSNACPVELSAQIEAFRGLMGAEPQSAPQKLADSGVSTSCT